MTPALHDPDGMLALLGGPAAAGAWLDRFFGTAGPPGDRFLGQEGVIGQYAQGNEPSHHIAYFYAWTDRPWHGHERLREIVSRFYTDAPDGIPGNDDAGQLSAWYVYAVLGLYPMVPASGEYVLAAPQVSAAVVKLAPSRELRIVAAGQGGDRTYAKTVSWRARAYRERTIPYADLVAGGTLRFSFVNAPD
jgi:putative alpha-1,2-mannosidase